MQKIKYSIIVPVYNAENVLRRCIDSILTQTIIDLELILVNDGSRDDSGKICDEYAAKDFRIQVIHQKNGGVSNARNSGLNVAKGKYIVFIDSDDYVDRDYLEKFSEANADLIISGYTLEGYNIPTPIIQNYDNEKLSDFSKTELGLYFEKGLLDYACIKAFSAEIIQKYQIRFCEQLDLAEDTLFVVQYSLRCKSMQKIDSQGYHYVKYSHETLSSNQTNVQEMIGKIEFANKLIYIEMKTYMGEKAEIYVVRRISKLYKSILSGCLYGRNCNLKYIRYLYKQIWFRKTLGYVDEIWNDENLKYRAILKTKSALCFWLFAKIRRLLS